MARIRFPYVIVRHSWFQDSKGFDTKIVWCLDQEDADRYATQFEIEGQTTFKRQKAIALPIEQLESDALDQIS